MNVRRPPGRRCPRAMKPRVVSTPVTPCVPRRIPVTSQCSMISTPASEAPRAYPHATASWRTVPPRGCRNPPSTGKRPLSRSTRGTRVFTVSRLNGSASTPCSRIMFARRVKRSRCASVWNRLSVPRWLTIALKLSSLLEPFPQLQREFVEPDVVGLEVVGADDRGVAPDVAEADRALLQHRDIANAKLGCEVIGGGEPMPATAHDHDPIARPRRRLGPGARPAAMAAEALEKQPCG